jgi:hypothetical protein
MLYFVLGHAGVKGNKRAGRLVNMPVEQGGTAMDRTGIPNVHRDNYRTSEAAKDSESTTMIRLNELHIKASGLDGNNMLGSREELLTSLTRGPLVVTPNSDWYTQKEIRATMDVSDVQ